MISILEPIFQGPLAELGDALILAPDTPPSAVPVRSLIDGALPDALSHYATVLEHDQRDLRPVASAWSMAYLAALLPPFCAAATLLEHVFPVAAEQTWVTLDANGMPLRFYITTAGAAMPQSSARQRYAPLIQHHLAPLFTALSAVTRIPLKILWGNAARHLQAIFDMADQLMPGMARIQGDRTQLLDSPTCNDAPNPLHGRERCVAVQENGSTTMLTLHRQCCLYYLLPQHDYCPACPLDPRLRPSR